MKTVIILFFLSFFQILYSFEEKEIFLGYKTPLFEADSLCFYPSGKLECAKLIENTVFRINGQDIEFQAKEYLFFYESGAIKQGMLHKNTEMQTYLFRKQTWLFFYESGLIQSGHLQRNTSYKINLQYIPLADSQITFYPSGKIRSAYLKEDTLIDNILFRSAENSFSNITFYESGKVKEAYLAEDKILQGIAFRKNHWISFYESGNVSGGTLAFNTFIDGIYYLCGTWIALYESGKPSAGYLAIDSKIGSKLFKKGFEIQRDRNGFILAQD